MIEDEAPLDDEDPQLPVAAETQSKLVALAESFGDNPLGQATLAVVGVIVGAPVAPLTLGAGLLAWCGKRGKQRLEQMIEELKKANFRPTPELLDDTDFLGTLEATVDRVLRAPRSYRVELLARLLAGSSRGPEAGRAAEEHLSIIDQLTERDLAVLACLHRCQQLSLVACASPRIARVKRAYLLFEHDVEQHTGIPAGQARDTVERLCGTGLCRMHEAAPSFPFVTETFSAFAHALGLSVPDPAVGNRLPEADLANMRLVDRDLAGADLARVRLDGSELDNAKLELARLEHSTMIGADLEGTDLRSATLVGADLTAANLLDARMENAQMQGATLSRSVLRKASLCGVDATDADFSGAVLSGANLDRARLCGACFDGAALDDANLLNAVVDGRTKLALEGSHWRLCPEGNEGLYQITFK